MEKELRVIVAGCRTFDNYPMLEHNLDKILHPYKEKGYNITIVSGAAIGTDKLGEKYAENKGLNLHVIPAEWFKLGRRAGIVRNGLMAEYAAEKEPLLVAFWNGTSRGTKNMIDQAKKKDIATRIVLITD